MLLNGIEWQALQQVTLVGPELHSVTLSVSNPAVKGSKGAAKAFVFAWWAGVITSFLGRNFEYVNVVYDEAANTMKCEIVPRGSPYRCYFEPKLYMNHSNLGK